MKTTAKTQSPKPQGMPAPAPVRVDVIPQIKMLEKAGGQSISLGCDGLAPPLWNNTGIAPTVSVLKNT